MSKKKKLLNMKVTGQNRWFSVPVEKDPTPPKQTLADLFRKAVGKK